MGVFFRYLILVIQLIGMLIIIRATMRLFYRYIKHQLFHRHLPLLPIRIRYVQALLLAFEVLLGGGVLITVLEPSWDDIGKLAAIATIRTIIRKILTTTIKNYELKHVL